MNHYNEFLKVVNSNEKCHDEQLVFQANIVRHFTELLGESKFNLKIQNYFINDNKFENNFFDFHKSMRQVDFFDLSIEGSGNVDMLFWNFVHISEAPYLLLKEYMRIYMLMKPFFKNIGKKVTKCSITEQQENRKPFKSGLLINTVKDVVMHDYQDVPAYIFEEDETQVECRRCKVVPEKKLTDYQASLLTNLYLDMKWPNHKSTISSAERKALNIFHNRGLIRLTPYANGEYWEMNDRGIDLLRSMKLI